MPSATSRRRSIVMMNVHANDPSVPAPGEMIANGTEAARTASPQLIASSPMPFARDRQPSLGELHQELEAEQEAQVNRLLVMIREQQLQLNQLQANQGQNTNQSAIDDSVSNNGATPPILASATSTHHHNLPSVSGSVPRSPSFPRHPRSSFDLARTDLHRRSRTPSRGASPRMRAGSIHTEHDNLSLSGRDESALYQAETHMLTRENQMLRHRIRELERQLSEVHSNTNVTHEPVTPSHLLSSQSVVEEDTSKPAETIT
ncbi:uncharacterized protein MKZ38_009875 [Zalerion maritima]|uniref:Uncharacterized protein n=1 Tax=Zalerion maritima TaxID=339359 RepID=A0AAD5RTU3_9PEZI|nr:uncharacterized protein MKZ38_009875 [Zalerion maritima]